MELNEILQIASRGGASDIHLKVGMPPICRIDGALVPFKDGQRLSAEEAERMLFGIMNEFQRNKFQTSNEIDLAYSVAGVGRFRVNVFQQRGVMGAVLRTIPFKILTLKELLLPPILEKITLAERGLILVTGSTGSGKSTTLAAMIDHINSNETHHIVTIEDPIEFLIRDKRSIINQREVGVDTLSFSQALKSALRQDPDVVLLGEMRDLETIETALLAAETGHMVMSTLHTIDSAETINRIVSSFPSHQQKQIRIQLASVLKAIISQRLVSRADGKGRVAAVEILKVTARIRDLIEDKDRSKEIPEAITQGHVAYGMQSFDQSLMMLMRQNIITYQEALRQASNPNNFELRFQGITSSSDVTWNEFDKESGKGPELGKAPTAAPTHWAQKQATMAAQQKKDGNVSQRKRDGNTRSGSSAVMHPATGVQSPVKKTDSPSPPKSDDDDFSIERF